MLETIEQGLQSIRRPKGFKPDKLDIESVRNTDLQKSLQAELGKLEGLNELPTGILKEIVNKIYLMPLIPVVNNLINMTVEFAVTGQISPNVLTVMRATVLSMAGGGGFMLASAAVAKGYVEARKGIFARKVWKNMSTERRLEHRPIIIEIPKAS